MNLAARQDRRMRVAEFRAMIEPYPDEERWELIDGQAVLMAPQSERHQRIVANLLDGLRAGARRRGCVALPGLGIVSDLIDDYAPIPDIVVRCGPPLSDSYARDPILIAEVLSPTTRNNDRGRKADFYETLTSLRTFLVVHQDQVLIEMWQRDGETWQFRTVGSGEAIQVPELDSQLSVADIYAGLDLG